MVIFFYYHFIFQAKLNHLHKFHPASQWEENFVWLQCLGHPDRGLQIMQVWKEKKVRIFTKAQTCRLQFLFLEENSWWFLNNLKLNILKINFSSP